MTIRQDLRRIGIVTQHTQKMDLADQEFLVAWLLNTTQAEVKAAGFRVRFHKREQKVGSTS